MPGSSPDADAILIAHPVGSLRARVSLRSAAKSCVATSLIQSATRQTIDRSTYIVIA
jgi:hypothetical protein